jgi:ABC-type nitrate/sulfonate/bicarbonate transport system permease component
MAVVEAGQALPSRTRAARRGEPFLSPGRFRFLLVVGLFVFWEAAVWAFGNPLFVAPPSRVIAAFTQIIRDPKLQTAVLTTMSQLAIAFGISLVGGLILGTLLGIQRHVRVTTVPILVMLYATPSVVFLPLVILWLGIEYESKVFMGVANGIFPITFAVIGGVQNINPGLMRAARSMGASRWQMFTNVVFPNMVPSLFTGMRLCMTATLIGVLIAELYISQHGIGYFTRRFTDLFEPAKVFALVGIISVFAIILNETARRAELYWGRWRV